MHTSPTPIRPPKGPRHYLVPIDGGPWLDDRSPTVFYRAMGLGGLATAVASFCIGSAPNALQIFWFGMVVAGALAALCGGGGFLSSFLARATTQTCPECLRRMDRGATTCPHCHFHPPQEGV